MSEDSGIQKPHITTINFNISLSDYTEKVAKGGVLDALEKFDEFCEALRELGFTLNWYYNISKIPEGRTVAGSPQFLVPYNQIALPAGGNAKASPNFTSGSYPKTETADNLL